VIINPVVWNGINLWMLGRQFLVESIHGRVRRRNLDCPLTKANVQLGSLGITKPFVRIPNSKIVAHDS
jgi:hypothetical protein